MKFQVTTDVKDFINFITCSESSFRGCHQLWLRDGSGQFKEVFYSKSDKFADGLYDFVFNSSCDYYITSNSFYADKRSNACLFSLNNIVIDLDGHNLTAASCRYMVDKFLYILSDSDIIAPSAVVSTGRGLQLWYHTSGDSSALQWLYAFVALKLRSIWSDFISDNDIGLSVDCCSGCSGLYRLPSSFNSLASELSCLEYCNYVTYEINDLIADVPSAPERFSSDNRSSLWDKLNYKRVSFLENYVESYSGAVTGKRNTICWLYYSAAVQIFEKSYAVKRLEDLVSLFSLPYSSSDVASVIRSCDKHIYKISNDKFFELLDLTAAEIDLYNSGSRKYVKKVDKVERNRKIRILAADLINQKDIASSVGCSERTVRTVLKDFNKKEYTAIQVQSLRRSMSISETARALNISPATVKNLQNSIF